MTMTDRMEKLEQQLLHITARQLPPDVTLDEDETCLRDAWLCLGQLLEHVSGDLNEEDLLETVARDDRWKRRAVALVAAAALLVAVGLIGWYWSATRGLRSLDGQRTAAERRDSGAGDHGQLPAVGTPRQKTPLGQQPDTSPVPIEQADGASAAMAATASKETTGAGPLAPAADVPLQWDDAWDQRLAELQGEIIRAQARRSRQDVALSCFRTKLQQLETEFGGEDL